MIQILLPVAVLCSGLAAGGLMISALGGAPLLLSLPVDRYIVTHQFLVTRFDPFMPVNMCTALLMDLGLALVGPSAAARALAGAGCVMLAGAMAVSLTKNVPINRWILAIDPDRVPSGWDRIDPRVRWRNWNLVRTALVCASLLSNVAIVGVSV